MGMDGIMGRPHSAILEIETNPLIGLVLRLVIVIAFQIHGVLSDI
jgi:hypothetical protein